MTEVRTGCFKILKADYVTVTSSINVIEAAIWKRCMWKTHLRGQKRWLTKF